MPKVKYSETTQFYNKITNNIKSYSALNGNSNSITQISKRVNIPQSTLSDKMANPRKFTLEDLYKIAKGLNVDLKIIGEFRLSL